MNFGWALWPSKINQFIPDSNRTDNLKKCLTSVLHVILRISNQGSCCYMVTINFSSRGAQDVSYDMKNVILAVGKLQHISYNRNS